MHIRPLQAEDHSAVYQLMIATANVDNHTPYTLWQAATFDPQFFWVAHDSNTSQIAGYVFGRPVSKDKVFLWQIAVNPAFRGQRIGHRLVQAFTHSAQIQGFKQLTTTISKGNLASEKLFQSIAAQYQQALEEMGETGSFGQTMSSEVCYQFNIPHSM